MKRFTLIFLLIAAIAFSGPVSNAAISADEKEVKPSEDRFAEVEKKWGVKPLSIRLTGSGHFLDFRYRVTDAEKAKPILSRGNKAYLMDQESGKVMTVPVTKIGQMRGTTLQPKAGRQYFILFSNTGMIVKEGQKVSVIIEDFKVENLAVE